MNMRELVLSQLKDAIDDGWDSPDGNDITSLDSQSDSDLLDLYDELVGFNG